MLISEASFTGPALDHSCNRQRGTGIPRTARVIPHEVPTRVYSNWQADQPVLGCQILEGAILVRNSIENGALIMQKNVEFITFHHHAKVITKLDGNLGVAFTETHTLLGDRAGC